MSDGAVPTEAARPGRDAARPTGAAPARAATVRPVDERALARHAGRLMSASTPWLHQEVARRMAERLAVLKQPPHRIVDWGAQLGGSQAVLQRACPRARLESVEVFAAPARSLSAGAEAAAAPTRWWRAMPWRPAAGRADHRAARNESLLADGEADLLWSNMVLHHFADPQAVFARWLRLLAVDGLLMFSTLGPGSLASLRRLYARQGWAPPHAPFVDMHDLGDQLVQVGFADPVMDQEVLTLTWATPAGALAELRQLGGNAHPGRHAGLRTPRWRAALEQALAPPTPAGRVQLEFEVVYGHAVRPPVRATVSAQTTLPLADLRGMLRAGRGGTGRR